MNIISKIISHINDVSPITRIYLQSLDQVTLEKIETQIRWSLSVEYYGYNTLTKATNQIAKVLQGQVSIDSDSKFYHDSDDGEVQVISDFTENFHNTALQLVQFQEIAKIIAEDIFVEGKKDYRRDKYILKIND